MNALAQVRRITRIEPGRLLFWAVALATVAGSLHILSDWRATSEDARGKEALEVRERLAPIGRVTLAAPKAPAALPATEPQGTTPAAGHTDGADPSATRLEPSPRPAEDGPSAQAATKPGQPQQSAATPALSKPAAAPPPTRNPSVVQPSPPPGYWYPPYPYGSPGYPPQPAPPTWMR